MAFSRPAMDGTAVGPFNLWIYTTTDLLTSDVNPTLRVDTYFNRPAYSDGASRVAGLRVGDVIFIKCYDSLDVVYVNKMDDAGCSMVSMAKAPAVSTLAV